MTNIVTDNVEVYIKRLILEAFGHNANGNDPQQNLIQTDGKTDPKQSRSNSNGQLKTDPKEE